MLCAISPNIPKKMEIWLSQNKKKKGFPRSMTQKKRKEKNKRGNHTQNKIREE
jgi:hypothetical protein